MEKGGGRAQLLNPRQQGRQLTSFEGSAISARRLFSPKKSSTRYRRDVCRGSTFIEVFQPVLTVSLGSLTNQEKYEKLGF